MYESKRDAYIYKVLTLAQWSDFQTTELFLGSEVDVEDGFIHLSRASQLTVTLNKWYADQVEVAILEVDAEKFDAGLKYELSRGGQEFPHLFEALPISAVTRVWLASPKNAVYRLPRDLSPDSKETKE